MASGPARFHYSVGSADGIRFWRPATVSGCLTSFLVGGLTALDHGQSACSRRVGPGSRSQWESKLGPREPVILQSQPFPKQREQRLRSKRWRSAPRVGRLST